IYRMLIVQSARWPTFGRKLSGPALSKCHGSAQGPCKFARPIWLTSIIEFGYPFQHTWNPADGLKTET
ncbi:MAG TPA: hypothetical protein VHB50_20110, partial [Bryobacteraceae bacterium]|nr:hypothetical protein [Bryobacteraceae bacterium]